MGNVQQVDKTYCYTRENGLKTMIKCAGNIWE